MPVAIPPPPLFDSGGPLPDAQAHTRTMGPLSRLFAPPGPAPAVLGPVPLDPAAPAAPAPMPKPPAPVEFIDPEREEQMVRKWQKRLQARWSEDREVKYRQKLKMWRKAAAGWLPQLDADTREVAANSNYRRARTNILYATISTIAARLVAKNPEFGVAAQDCPGTPSSDVIATQRMESETGEVMLKREVTTIRFKDEARALVLAAMIGNRGWIKVSPQEDIQEDPLIRSRLDDTQALILKMQSVQKALAANQAGAASELTGVDSSPLSEDEIKQKLEELRTLNQTLEAQVEVARVRTVAVDRVPSEEILVFGVRELSQYESANAIAQPIPMRLGAFRALYPTWKAGDYDGLRRFKTAEDASGADGITRDSGQGMSASGGAGPEKDDEFVRVWEVWDRETGTVFTIADGVEKYCKPPRPPVYSTRHFFPYVMLAFNPIPDSEEQFLSDVEMLIPSALEYEDARDKQRAARAQTRLAGFVDTSRGDVDANTFKLVSVSDDIDIVAGNFRGRDISKIVAYQALPTVPGYALDTSNIRSDIEVLSKAGDAARGTVTKAKTATEANILEAGLSSTIDDRRDVIEACLSKVGDIALELLYQLFVPEEVAALLGPAAAWPVYSKDLPDRIKVAVQAGSTGNPNQQQEREDWTEIMPLIQQAQTTIMTAPMLYAPILKLLEETCKRFNIRIDPAQFLPPPPPPMPVPGAPPGMGAPGGDPMDGTPAANDPLMAPPPGAMPAPAAAQAAPAHAPLMAPPAAA